jgi:hypothetical protein
VNRQRVVLEVITAVLLGLVSVGTTYAAYQATVLGQQASDLESISTQLRDRNLTELLSSQLAFTDDGRRVTAAFALQGELVIRPENAAEVAAQQQALVAAASPALRDAWDIWASADFAVEKLPLTDPDYTVALYALPQSLQYASAVTDRMVERLTARSLTLTSAAVVFAIALFLLGVAGVLSAARAVIPLISVGALLLVIGAIVTLVASG